MLCQIDGVVKELFGDKKLYLEVRTWNHRAIACYQKAGLQIVREAFRQNMHLGEDEYYRMEKGGNKSIGKSGGSNLYRL